MKLNTSKIILYIVGLFFLLISFFSYFSFSNRLESPKNNSFATRYNPWGGNLKVYSNDGFYEAVDGNIYMTDKLVYKNKEDIKVYAFSAEKTFYDFVDPYQNLTISNGIIKPSKNIISKNAKTKFNLKSGFNLNEFNFSKSEIPLNYNGWFLINIKQQEKGSILQSIPIFISNNRKTSDTLFIEGTDTFKAYNFAGNFWSYYNQPTMLGGLFFRPKAYPANYKIIPPKAENLKFLNCSDHLINADSYLQKSLRSWDLKFDSKPDEFLDNYSNFANYKTIIFGSHNEYWTLEKMRNIIKFIDKGGKVIYLGGNTAWRNIERSDNGNYIWGSNMLTSPWMSAQKGRQDLISTRELNYFLFNYLGSYYDSRGINSSAPFIDNKNNIIGTVNGLKQCNQTYLGLGASGHETDKLYKDSVGFTVLARGQNDDGGGAEIVYKKFPSGGEVFNMGSVSAWMYINDPSIKSLVKKYIES